VNNGVEPAAYKFTCNDEDCGGTHLSIKSNYPQSIKCAGGEHAGSKAFRGSREMLYAASDLPRLVEFIIGRLMDGNALSEDGADKLRREVDDEFRIYGDVSECDSKQNSGDEQ